MKNKSFTCTGCGSKMESLDEGTISFVLLNDEVIEVKIKGHSKCPNCGKIYLGLESAKIYGEAMKPHRGNIKLEPIPQEEMEDK